MNLWKRVQKLIGGKPNAPMPRPRLPIVDDEPEISVPEISVEELQAELASPQPPLVIDVREPYEWRLVRMAEARHIPMNEVPNQLESIPRDRGVVVMCSHGSRSYSVAAWLIEQGVQASSLAGGITQWAARGGPVEQGGSEHT
jgi:rhodanese-related sulfurtransferase